MNNTNKKKSNDGFELARKVSVVMLIPMMFLAGPVVGFLIGYGLDLKFHWDPWGKTICSLLGFVASVREVMKLIKQATKDQNHE